MPNKDQGDQARAARILGIMRGYQLVILISDLVGESSHHREDMGNDCLARGLLLDAGTLF